MIRVFSLAWQLIVIFLVGASALIAAWEYISMRRYRGFDENGVCKRCSGVPEVADDPILGLCPNCDGEGHK